MGHRRALWTDAPRANRPLVLLTRQGAHRCLHRALLVLAVAVAVWRACHPHASHGLVLADEYSGDGGFGFGGGNAVVAAIIAVLQYIWDALLGFAEYALKALNFIWDALVKGLAKLAEGFVRTGQWFGKILDVLRRFWRHVLQPFLQFIGDMLRILKYELERIFGPILKLIRNAIQFVRDIYRNFVRPILDVIDAFRVFLKGLGALGVDWAKELDRKLGEFEDKINAPFLSLLHILNQIAGYIDRIMTLDGIFTRLIWLQSLGAYRRPTIRWFWNSQHRETDSSEIDRIHKKSLPPEQDQIVASAKEVIATKTGDLGPQVSELETQMRIWLRD